MKLADHAHELIDFITSHFDCYWLTTHCKGSIRTPLTYLSTYLDEMMLEKLKLLKPTQWETLKTEAIDFSSDFFWLDDQPFDSEKRVLDAHSALDKLIIVHLENKDEIKRIVAILQASMPIQ